MTAGNYNEFIIVAPVLSPGDILLLLYKTQPQILILRLVLLSSLETWGEQSL